MNEKLKYIKEIEQRLGSGKTSVILNTLTEIRIKGSVEMLPAIMKLIAPGTESEVKKETIRLISQLKEQAAVPYLISGLEERNYGQDLAALLATFWQCGLNFSDHISRVVPYFIGTSYQTSIEVFTIIEEALPLASQEEISKCIDYLNQNKNNLDPEKIPLFHELIKTLSSFTDH